MYGLLTQWAAVTTQVPLRRVPPQKWAKKEPAIIWSEICHGNWSVSKQFCVVTFCFSILTFFLVFVVHESLVCRSVALTNLPGEAGIPLTMRPWRRTGSSLCWASGEEATAFHQNKNKKAERPSRVFMIHILSRRFNERHSMFSRIGFFGLSV